MIIDVTKSGDIAQVISYPAGELQIRIKPEHIAEIESASDIAIRTHLYGISMHQHLMALCLLADAITGIKGFGFDIELQLPYLPYSRADRRFTAGDCHGLGTFANLLKTCCFSPIRTLDAHNVNKSTNLLPRLINVTPRAQILRAITDFEEFTGHKPVVLFPDAGAQKRYRNCIPADIDIFYASKVRDASTTGVLHGFTVPFFGSSRPAIIIDDICDGGGTFNGIAEELHTTNGHTGKLGLYVTHGIFSKGISKLEENFARIYTTDSISIGLNHPHASVLRIWDAFEALNDTANETETASFGRSEV